MSCKASFCLYFQAGSCLSAMLLASICSKEIINFSDLTEVRCCLRMACVLPHIIRNCCALCFVFKLDCQTQACFIVGVVGHEINFGYKCFSCLLWVVVLSSFAWHQFLCGRCTSHPGPYGSRDIARPEIQKQLQPQQQQQQQQEADPLGAKRPTYLAPSGMPATINATFETTPPAQPTLAKHNKGIAITLHRNCHSTPHKFPRDTQCLRPNTTTQGHALNTPTGTAQGPRPPTASHERCALPEHRQTRQPEHHTIKPQVQVPAAGQKDNKVKGRYNDQQWVAIDTPLVSFWKNVADWLTRLPSGIFCEPDDEERMFRSAEIGALLLVIGGSNSWNSSLDGPGGESAECHKALIIFVDLEVDAHSHCVVQIVRKNKDILS